MLVFIGKNYPMLIYILTAILDVMIVHWIFHLTLALMRKHEIFSHLLIRNESLRSVPFLMPKLFFLLMTSSCWKLFIAHGNISRLSSIIYNMESNYNINLICRNYIMDERVVFSDVGIT